MTSLICGNSCVILDETTGYYYMDASKKLTFQMKSGGTITVQCNSTREYQTLKSYIENFYQADRITSDGALVARE